MVWVVVLIVVVFLGLRFPAFGMLALVVAVLGVLLIAGYLVQSNADSENAKKLVRADQLEFVDMRLGPSSYGYRLTGRIRNNSPYAVTSVTLKINGEDCNAQGHCDVVGDATDDFYSTIPAGQVRDVDDGVYFPSAMKIEGQFSWNYSVSEIRAQK